MLELVDVTAGYGSAASGAAVLHRVNLRIPDASVVALLGPNGAGKTTLLRVAARALPVRSGRVELDGRDHTSTPAHRLAAAGVCYVPEGRGVFPALTVADNLALFARSTSRDAIDIAVDAFPFLARRLGNQAGDLSGGERQMLALVRAWLVRPRVVLLDEVSMGLAPLVVDDVYAFLHRLRDEGIALLVVEQYVNRVREFADHVHLIRNGEIAFSGTPDELGSEEEILGRYLGSAISS